MTSDAQLPGPPANSAAKPSQNPSINTPTATESAPDSLVTQLGNLKLSGEPPRGRTENISGTFLSSGNPCLDFFFHVVPDTPSDQLIQRLELAWAHDSLTTLKLQETDEKAEVSDKEIDGALPLEDDVKEMGSENDKDKARTLRKEREKAKAERALDKYNSDSDYRFLFDHICELFAEYLKSDIKNLNEGKLFDISLAAKWCPSIDSSYDKTTLIYEGIARRVFPRDSEKEYKELEEGHYAYRIKDRLRKQVLVPLHKALELPEVYMSAKEWNLLPYNRVPSLAMKKYKEFFTKHDNERFKEYLDNVKTGKEKIAAGALLPHEIIRSLKDEDGGEVAELQWSRMVEDVAKKGKLKNSIAVCDVSKSMIGIPMEVSVALGLLVSELSEEPWKGKVITFSRNPELHKIEGDTLKAKTEFVRKMDWGANTDFQKVFDQILLYSVKNKVSKDGLVKRVFVLSDMEFDQANGKRDEFQTKVYGRFVVHSNCTWKERHEKMDENRKEWVKNGKAIMKMAWETDYEVIQRKYRDCGYCRVPEIVFWNLRNSSSTPVVATQNGVAMVSGFSKNLLSLFVEEGGIVNPEQVMGLAIAGEEYKKLAVFD
ncbi:hypothetical protein COLO4_15986 [Corchorus olitorius]|uniref:Uncharacterized protein n=1 Tax=Corchorus olitorius TaxID=93759 RepID=A0A1R3JKK4_9ROSI|nr:hypothetical protein COLO4_15986 [Corchorus olitorius]